jgi:hypothetical protein
MAEDYARGYSWPAMNWQAPDLAKEWERFYQHCQFTFGGPLSKCSKKEKICNLMNFVGDKGREKYLTFQWNTITVGSGTNATKVNEKDNLESVVKKFKDHVEAKKNPIRAAIVFDKRAQQPNEPFDDFVTSLILLARGMDITESEKLIHNAIACRSQDERVRQKCVQKGRNLTLDDAIEIGRSFESTQDTVKIMTGEDPKVAVNKLSNSKQRPMRRRSRKSTPPTRNQKNPNPNNSRDKCIRCGADGHKPQERCPAKRDRCSKCRKIGHWASQCLSRASIYGLDGETDEDSDNDYLSEDNEESVRMLHIKGLDITTNSLQTEDDEWWETVYIGKGQIRCQLDTGAKANVISKGQLDQVAPSAKLGKTSNRLVTFSKDRIVPIGKVQLTTRHKDTEILAKFYVIAQDQVTVLSGGTSRALGLIQRIHTLDQSTMGLLKQYPLLEQATGTLPGTYTIKIDPTVKPVVHRPRRQPAALLPRIIEKLKEMENEGHLRRVSVPTDWVNSMVVSTRRDKVRICVDPSDLNGAVKREHYPIPTVEEIVSRNPGGKVFSVLDAKSGFLQMKLDYESSLLTTMNTPIGRFRWTRLPFGIKSAPEMYQRTMDGMLEGIDQAYAVMDDILVVGKDVKSHDETLRMVLERAQSYNLKLNFDKVKVRKDSVP